MRRLEKPLDFLRGVEASSGWYRRSRQPQACAASSARAISACTSTRIGSTSTVAAGWRRRPWARRVVSATSAFRPPTPTATPCPSAARRSSMSAFRTSACRTCTTARSSGAVV